MAPPSIKVLMSCVVVCVVGSVYFCKSFFAFVTNFFPTSTAALFPASRAFFAPSLARLLPTLRAQDAICLAAQRVKILVKKLAMVSKILKPPYVYLLLNLCLRSRHTMTFWSTFSDV